MQISFTDRTLPNIRHMDQIGGVGGGGAESPYRLKKKGSLLICLIVQVLPFTDWIFAVHAMEECVAMAEMTLSL